MKKLSDVEMRARDLRNAWRDLRTAAVKVSELRTILLAAQNDEHEKYEACEKAKQSLLSAVAGK